MPAGTFSFIINHLSLIVNHLSLIVHSYLILALRITRQQPPSNTAVPGDSVTMRVIPS